MHTQAPGQGDAQQPDQGDAHTAAEPGRLWGRGGPGHPGKGVTWGRRSPGEGAHWGGGHLGR